MIEKLEQAYDRLLIQLFMRIGKRFYNVIVTYAEGQDEDIRCIHFAVSERDLNTSVREYVERLDEPS